MALEEVKGVNYTSIRFDLLRVRSVQAQAYIRNKNMEILRSSEKTATDKLASLEHQLVEDLESEQLV